MTFVPTPIVDEDAGKREIVDPSKKNSKKRNADGTEKQKPRVLITIIMGIIAVAWLFPLLGLLITSFRSRADVDAMAGGRLPQPVRAGLDLRRVRAGVDGTGCRDDLLELRRGHGAGDGAAGDVRGDGCLRVHVLQFRGKEIYFASLPRAHGRFRPDRRDPDPAAVRVVRKHHGIQIIGQYPAAWIVHATFAMPLAVYILRNYMQTLPNSLIEAARVDGASHFQIFWRLIVPMSVPALASFAIFQFLWVWNDFFVAYLFIQSGPNQVLTQGLYTLLGQYGQGWQRVAAGSFITLVVPLVIFFGLQRFFVRGLTAGSVK